MKKKRLSIGGFIGVFESENECVLLMIRLLEYKFQNDLTQDCAVKTELSCFFDNQAFFFVSDFFDGF